MPWVESSRAAPDVPVEAASFAPLALDLVALLEQQIVTRQLAPGARLIEAELCERHRVSRTPLREALRALEACGLAVRRPRLGVHVAPMTLENLDHIYSCRVPLEALAAAALAGSADRDASVQRLASCLNRMEEALGRQDLAAGFAANVALTSVLHRGSGNPVLASLLARLDKPALRYRHWAYLEQREMLPLAVRANRTMLGAIAAGEPARAESVVRSLVTRAWALTREAFIARPQGVVDAASSGNARRGPGRPRRIDT